MQVEWFADDSAFEKLHGEWDELLARSITDTLFLTWDWQTVWWRNLGSGELCIITVREDDGTLVAILPLFYDAAPDGVVAGAAGTGLRTLSLVGCVDVSDYLDVIIARGKEADIYPLLVDTLLRPDFPKWDRLQFCTLPAASPTNAGFKAAAEARGLAVDWQLHDVSPLIELPGTFDEYLEKVDKKQRHEIRRKLRRMEEAGGKWIAVRSGAEMDAAVADFIELHKKSQPEKHLFMDERMQRFFVDMARTLQAHDWVQLEFVDIGGERAAAVFDFVYANRVLVYNSGYDPAKYGALSPGVTLFALSIREAIAAGRSVYDFLRGDEEYKYRFGAKNSKVYELHLTH